MAKLMTLFHRMDMLLASSGRYRSFPGQGGVIAFAVLILVFLVIGGGSIAMLKQTSAVKNVVDQRNLQSYYVAMAGVQEALATRMYPSSNALAWWRPQGYAAGIGAMPLYGPGSTTNYLDEGIVCQTAGQPCPANSIIGMYRYFVLNGDQGVDAANSNGTNITYWSDATTNARSLPTKIDPLAFPSNATNVNNVNSAASEFVIVSRGYTCVPITGTGANITVTGIAQAGAIVDRRLTALGNTPPANNTEFQVPTCQTGFGLDRTTIMTRVILASDDGNPDRVISSRVLHTNVGDTADIDLTLPGSRKAFLPGVGWTSASFKFEPIFSYFGGGNAAANPAVPKHVIFYDFVNSRIICSANITGTTTDLRGNATCNTNRITPKTVIQLYFAGPIDHRSIDGRDNYSLSNCVSGTGCNIQISNITNTPAVTEDGYQLIFEPPKSNQIKLLPNLQSLPTAAQNYEVSVNTANIRTWSGSRGPAGPYRIQFRVQ